MEHRSKLGATIVALLAAAVATTMLDACDDSETNGQGGAGGAGGSAAQSYGDSACGTCVKSACATEIDACAADPSCGTYLSCLYECPVAATGDVDAACEAGCPAVTGSTGETAKANLDACRRSGPGAQCTACGGSSDGGSGGGGGMGEHPILDQDCPPSVATDECAKCDEERNCETWEACDANPACKDLVRCYLDSALPCVLCAIIDCGAQHPAGYEDFITWYAGAFILCQAECWEADACSTCWTTECRNLLAHCWTDIACLEAFDCTVHCDEPSCLDQCLSARPEARPVLEPLLLCLTEQCAGC